MAHTVTGLWNNLIDFENMYHACRAASLGKRYRDEVLRFTYRKEEKLITIINELVWDMYKPLPFREFWITDPKKRLISAPAFRDRVVHHAICKVIEPVFENRFIKETFACRVGKGTHAANGMVRPGYSSALGNVLKCDVHKFFQSIDHEILKAIIRRSIRDQRVLHLLDTIIDSYNSGEDKKGIPIGALTSQLFANVYLDPLDHYLKEEHRVMPVIWTILL